jgi:hypothetical protein
MVGLEGGEPDHPLTPRVTRMTVAVGPGKCLPEKEGIMKSLVLSVGLLLAVSPSAAFAQSIESYVARLSAADHFNSNGERLTSVAAIIRQDRANLYVYGKGDPEDETDSFFSDKGNRAKLENMLNRGMASKASRQAILNGTPMIRVEVHPDFINVEVYRD